MAALACEKGAARACEEGAGRDRADNGELTAPRCDAMSPYGCRFPQLLGHAPNNAAIAPTPPAPHGTRVRTPRALADSNE
jgi:hypothetical protein